MIARAASETPRLPKFLYKYAWSELLFVPSNTVYLVLAVEAVSNGLSMHPGVYEFANGDIFAGTFEGDHPCGHGIYTTKNKGRLEGEFRSGQTHGLGIRVLADGTMAAGIVKEIAEVLCRLRAGRNRS